MTTTEQKSVFQDLIETADKLGFKEGYSSIFKAYSSRFGIGREVILYQPEHGLILYACTKDGDTFSRASLHGEVHLNYLNSSPEMKNVIHKFTWGMINEDEIWFKINIGIKECWKDCLRKLLESGVKFNSVWQVQHDDLDFVNPEEERGEENAKKVVKSKLQRCNKEVRNIVCYA